jgi:hypothetical protein
MGLLLSEGVRDVPVCPDASGWVVPMDGSVVVLVEPELGSTVMLEPVAGSVAVAPEPVDAPAGSAACATTTSGPAASATGVGRIRRPCPSTGAARAVALALRNKPVTKTLQEVFMGSVL